ncbi:MAG: radical SAM protein [Bacillota bacterium]|nr:radical SAM protein [Bacillota bacterium]
MSHIPAKKCPYSCVYCQLGGGYRQIVARSAFYDSKNIIDEVKVRVEQVINAGESIDYVTLVPDGEPTLDQNLGAMIRGVQPVGLRVAVMTNASLISRLDVRNDLSYADLVSIKVDSVDKHVCRKVNRPYRSLALERILDGILEFAHDYRGELITETMLVRDVNDDEGCVNRVAQFLSLMGPARAYVAIPTRPPALAWAVPTEAASLNTAYQVMRQKVGQAEYLIGYEPKFDSVWAHAEWP